MLEDIDQLLKGRYAHYSSSMKQAIKEALKELKPCQRLKKETLLQIEKEIEAKYFANMR